MERDFQVYWETIVAEAVKQRKSAKLTQQELSALAGVSKPTIIRFENAKENITLKSAFAILNVLGVYGVRAH